MIQGNMMIKIISGWKIFTAILASIQKCSREMYIFNMFSQVASIIAFFSAKCAFVRFSSNWWNNILVKENFITWKVQILGAQFIVAKLEELN